MAKTTASKGTINNKSVKTTPVTTTTTTTTASKSNMSDFTGHYRPSHEEIAMRAYVIWQNKGCPIGHDAEDWFEAERQLLQTMKTTRR